MKRIFTILIILISISLPSQILSGTITGGGTGTMSGSIDCSMSPPSVNTYYITAGLSAIDCEDIGSVASNTYYITAGLPAYDY